MPRKKTKPRKESIQQKITNALLKSELNRIPRELVTNVVGVVSDEIANVLKKVELEKAIDHIAKNYTLNVKAEFNLKPNAKSKRSVR